MIAECENEQTMLMWSTANELLEIPNDNEDKIRLEEFKRRFSEVRHQQVPLSSLNTTKKTRRTRHSNQKTIPQQVDMLLFYCYLIMTVLFRYCFLH